MARLITSMTLLLAVAPAPCAARGFLAQPWLKAHPKGLSAGGQQQQACSALKNHGGIFFSVDVEVGTPGQTFSVVADTGSNTLIVPSCACPEFGYCGVGDRCFLGTNHSASYKLLQGFGGPEGLKITFGSGQISGYLAQESVRVGQLKTLMKDGLLLMTIKQLSFSAPFEGILGLGIPRSPPEQQAVVPGHSQSVQERIKEIMRRIKQARAAASGGAQLAAPAAPSASRQLPGPGGFLEQANISRFSMCFNDDGADGVLRIGGGPMKQAHGSVGRAHWGVDLRGVSIGNASVPLKLCSQGNLTTGRPAGCGAIPDSGTTFIMVPPAHLSVLYLGLCDAWPRCRNNFTALSRAAEAARQAAIKYYKSDPFEIKVSNSSKMEVLAALLEDCETWLAGDGPGLDEFPPLKFHIAGSGGTEQTLTLPGSAYIIQDSTHDLADNATVGAGNKTARGGSMMRRGGNKTVCKPAIASMHSLMGDTWILGQPFYYEYNVGYDLATSPPSMSFTSTREVACGSCDKEAGLVSEGVSRARTGRPRALSGSPRLPSFDVTQPL